LTGPFRDVSFEWSSPAAVQGSLGMEKKRIRTQVVSTNGRSKVDREESGCGERQHARLRGECERGRELACSREREAHALLELRGEGWEWSEVWRGLGVPLYSVRGLG
jgi:hypothetical protein